MKMEKIDNRRRSPSGRPHVYPGDKVQHVRGSGIGTVIKLDSLENHVQAKVRWPTGYESWDDLNTLILREPSPLKIVT